MTREEMDIKDREFRQIELIELLDYINEICTKYDLRFGQLMQIVFSGKDIFNLENNEIQKKIVKWLKDAECR